MHKLLYYPSIFYKKITLFVERRVEEFGAQYIAFGIFGAINYPLSYFMWQSGVPQLFNPLSMRIAAALLCLPLIFKNYWPQKLTKFLPLYWYFTLLYCLPFFASFMLLKNHFSTGWLMNDVLGLFLFILLVDWLSFLILILLGVLLGWFFYWLTEPVSTNYSVNKEILYLAIYMYLFAIVIGTIFSRNKEIIAKEKLQTIKAIGASIAHELRTPLRTINSAAHGMKRHFSALLDGYQLAKKEKLPVQYISPHNLETLLTACDDIELEAEAAFTVINMLLVNVTQSVETHDFKTTSIERCIDETLKRYPFDIGEAQLVHWKHGNEFLFEGNELLIIHVLFNLLKNALYQIKAAGKGEIQIWTERGKKYNLLHFKDTAKGISPKILAHIFDRFFSKTYHGTGIGLAFCKIVMENLGGKIACQSVEGEYAEFILYFPNEPGLHRAASNDESETT